MTGCGRFDSYSPPFKPGTSNSAHTKPQPGTLYVVINALSVHRNRGGIVPAATILRQIILKILAIEHENAGTHAEDFAPHLEAEAQRLWALYREGTLREIYFHADEHRAILMLECQDTAEAQQLLNTLPLVQHGLITFELLPLAPYTGYARLFAPS